jgi:asparagine synthase (glutamine-hydrolysing)
MCLAAGRHVRAPLAAHGGSTLWAGHARHRVERLEMAVRSVLVRPLAAIGAELGRSLQDAVKGARALSHLAMDPAGAYAAKHAYGFWEDEQRRALYTRGFAWQVRDSNPFARHLELYAARATADPLDRALYVDAHTSLPDSVLAVAESCARAAGIDVRYPLLDRELVACAASMPAGLKQRGAAGMYALRTLLARELPPALMPAARRLPARHPWLRPALQTLVPSVLLSPRFDGRGVVSRPALRQLWSEHESRHRDHSHRLWSLVMLELWFRDAIDGNAAEEPPEYAVLKAA